MRFDQWLLQNTSDIRDALPGEIPKLFIHQTNSEEDMKSIVQQGFNLGLFGKTSKLYRFQDMYSPKGVFALEYENGMENYTSRPYVIFSANINKALYFEDFDGKEVLYKQLDSKSPSDFRNKLLKLGYQAVLRHDSEQIILDPNIIKIIRWGIPQTK